MTFCQMFGKDCERLGLLKNITVFKAVFTSWMFAGGTWVRFLKLYFRSPSKVSRSSFGSDIIKEIFSLWRDSFVLIRLFCKEHLCMLDQQLKYTPFRDSSEYSRGGGGRVTTLTSFPTVRCQSVPDKCVLERCVPWAMCFLKDTSPHETSQESFIPVSCVPICWTIHPFVFDQICPPIFPKYFEKRWF